MEDLAQLLPEDLLADVVRRNAPRDLAVARCVCRAWRMLIDSHGLLRTDLLPLSLAGIFICFSTMDEGLEFEIQEQELFTRARMGITYYKPRDIDGYCNGLFLEFDSVFNPATGGRAPLPEPPVSFHLDERYFSERRHLAFDPTVSSHYEVFLVPYVRNNFQVKMRPADNVLLLQSEWPPSLLMLKVFSSRTMRWEDRSFVREGEAVGTVADLRLRSKPHHAVYCRGALYLRCQNNFVVRLSLSNHECRVIKPPKRIGIKYRKMVHLGKSEKGVYCALLDEKYHLWVWVLQGSAEQMEWAMKHCTCHALALPSLNCHQQAHGPWILQNANSEGASNETLVEQDHEWNSDDESILTSEDRVQKHHSNLYMGILGFHPYKEIVFLHTSMKRGLAYHLNSSKLEDLGNFCPKDYCPEYLEDSFPYTPCWTGELKR